MKLRERGGHLDPEAARELEALDRALAGRPVDPDLRELAELAELLADERPEPAPEWAGELDERVAGFRSGGSRSPFARLAGLRPTQILAPAGALATAAVIVAVGVSSLSEPDTAGDSATAPDISEVAGELGLSGGEDDSATSAESIVPEGALIEPAPDVSRDSMTPPLVQGLPGDEIAPGTENRKVERDVSMALSTRPEDVRRISDEAIAIVRSLNGIVASSQVSEAGGDARATLQLVLPARNLDSAIDRLTGLANVKSLDEATLDVTKPFVSAQDRLADAEEERASLLKALEDAATADEADALRAQIADATRRISVARSQFENIARRARLSDVSLTIVGDPNVEEDRSIGDWLDDAASVLRDVAGVLLISAAIVVPLGILLAIAWLVTARVRRSRRERALD